MSKKKYKSITKRLLSTYYNNFLEEVRERKILEVSIQEFLIVFEDIKWEIWSFVPAIVHKEGERMIITIEENKKLLSKEEEEKYYLNEDEGYIETENNELIQEIFPLRIVPKVGISKNYDLIISPYPMYEPTWVIKYTFLVENNNEIERQIHEIFEGYSYERVQEDYKIIHGFSQRTVNTPINPFKVEWL